MQRVERTGLGVSLAAHVALFGVLSLGLFAAPKPLIPPQAPVDVQLVDEVGLTATAPNPSPAEPAPSVAPEVAPPEPVAAPEPQAVAPPQPRPAPPKPQAVAPPKPVPAKPAPPKQAAKPVPVKPTSTPPRGSRLGSDFLRGISDRPTAGTSQAPRAAAGPAVQSSLAREVLRQLKPHWTSPSGADVELLRTSLTIRLARDGTVTSIENVETTGQTASNAGQVRLHQEAAKKAVRLASPFQLPAEFYDAWAVLGPVRFDKRLSQ
jgi:outer membrane biosynthesis protein TonB